MADEKIIVIPPPPQMVTTVMEPPKVENKGPSAKKPRRKYTKRQKTLKHSNTQTLSQDEPRSKLWLSALSNLVLLIAIFTIVLATHRAIQSGRISGDQGIRGSVLNATPSPPDLPNPPSSANLTNSPAVQPPEPAKILVGIPARAHFYRGKVRLPKLTDADLDNPWNNGSSLDLDGEKARLEYKKRYISTKEPDKDNNQ